MAAVSNNLKLFRQRNTESLGRIVACCFPQLELLVVSNRNKYQTGLRRKRESKKQQGRGERGNPKESVGLMTRAARRQLSLQVWCVLGQDDTVRTHFSFVLSHVFSVLAWLSDRLFPSSAPYKLCGDLHPPSFQSNKKKKKKKRKKGREGEKGASLLSQQKSTNWALLVWLGSCDQWQPGYRSLLWDSFESYHSLPQEQSEHPGGVCGPVKSYQTWPYLFTVTVAMCFF